MHYLQRIYKYMPNSELHITQNNAAKQYIKLTTTSTYHELYLAIDFYPLPLNTLHVPNIYISRYRRVSDSMSLKNGRSTSSGCKGNWRDWRACSESLCTWWHAMK